jgi:hypothetical protein
MASIPDAMTAGKFYSLATTEATNLIVKGIKARSDTTTVRKG